MRAGGGKEDRCPGQEKKALGNGMRKEMQYETSGARMDEKKDRRTDEVQSYEKRSVEKMIDLPKKKKCVAPK